MKTTDKAIIEKYKELNKLNEGLVSDASVTLTMHGGRLYLNEFIRKRDLLKSEIASLEAQDKEPSDQDIEKWITEQNYSNHKIMIAYKEGLRDGIYAMRDGKIYIAPKG